MFAVPNLPPLPSLLPLVAAAEAARDDGAALEELALRVAGAVIAALVDPPKAVPAPNARDARRVTETLRRIEAFNGFKAETPSPWQLNRGGFPGG